MTVIRTLYEKLPSFPATEQHPSATRYAINSGIYQFADCIGPAPPQAEIDTFLGTDAAGVALAARKATDEQERQDAKVDGTIMGLVNQTRAEWVTWCGTNFPSLTAPERQRLAALFWVVSVGVRSKVRNGG